MAFNDLFRLSSHAVITNTVGEVLLLKATYGDKHWGLPGGGLDPNETIHQALQRECFEELGCEVDVQYLSGVYFHSAYQSQAFIFRCELPKGAQISLSDEHSEYAFVAVTELSNIQQQRVSECLAFSGVVRSAAF
ncbi:NUDIX domain-containing protein [Shewanella sp. 11B5]|uniref:NUDIX hydrolase n=1 Tax=Shewanella frigidimarina (strain NCIMB 400) TaxID=318167 RepID=Q081E1_SHEFN|nr:MULTISPECIES: NUDIX domain-containing protein [Shewanella]ABI72124.1 NUDIX hydrolase [Shewanella frigidimarina NCIMB 400]PKI11211.1 NUDIX domain-containing protein [Shewanella sp. 11B5]RPA61717.1 NUDIX domain-containing protein [Shewanella frigidimarina]